MKSFMSESKIISNTPFYIGCSAINKAYSAFNKAYSALNKAYSALNKAYSILTLDYSALFIRILDEAS